MIYITNGKGDITPISDDWAEEVDELEEKFTLVRSRKKRSPKAHVVISRPVTRSQNPDRGGKRRLGSPVHHSRATRGGGRKKTGVK